MENVTLKRCNEVNYWQHNECAERIEYADCSNMTSAAARSGVH
jgi:hypothetical protein